jgi:hypothetical protein
MKAMTRIVPPQAAQRSGSTSNTFAMSLARSRRRARRDGAKASRSLSPEAGLSPARPSAAPALSGCGWSKHRTAW